MHNKAYYQPQMLCIGLHLSGTDPCSYSLYKMEELFSAQYFLFFLVTQWFWTKWSDKHLNFTSQGIFRGPWIIWTLFHNFSIFAIILSISIFFSISRTIFWPYFIFVSLEIDLSIFSGWKTLTCLQQKQQLMHWHILQKSCLKSEDSQASWMYY